MSKENFKAGDTVECIENRENLAELTIGKEYKVVASIVFNDGQTPSVMIVDDFRRETFYCSKDFKLAKQVPNYMMVWESGQSEKDAVKRDVVLNLNHHSRFQDEYPYVVVEPNGMVHLWQFAKSIEQWEADNKPKYRPFTMEEFDKVGIKLIHKKSKRRDVVVCYNDKVVTISDCDIKLTYADLLANYLLIDGTPCGVKE